MTETIFRTIFLNALILSPEMQVRATTCQRTVKEYQDALRAGARFPPIKVVRVDEENEAKGFILVDGWHRTAAYRNLGATKVEAEVAVNVQPHERRWLAVQQNRSHGLRLNRKDKRECFRAYIQAKQHRDPDRGNRIKSIREMEKDLQGIVSRTCVPLWMKADYPSVYRAMLAGGLEADQGKDFDGRADMDRECERLALEALDQFKANLRAVRDRDLRMALHERITEAALEVAEVVTGKRELPVALSEDF